MPALRSVALEWVDPVYVSSEERLGTSSLLPPIQEGHRRHGLGQRAALLALRPVTFHYKEEFDRHGIPQFGLVAEEVAEICPDLVLRDGKGEIYSVRRSRERDAAKRVPQRAPQGRATGSDDDSAQSTVAKQEATIAEQQKDFQWAVAQQQKETEALVARLDEQASQIRKVSDQLATASPSDGRLQGADLLQKWLSNRGTH